MATDKKTYLNPGKCTHELITAESAALFAVAGAGVAAMMTAEEKTFGVGLLGTSISAFALGAGIGLTVVNSMATDNEYKRMGRAAYLENMQAGLLNRIRKHEVDFEHSHVEAVIRSADDLTDEQKTKVQQAYAACRSKVNGK